jgi:subtilisin family serine protease
MRDGAALAGTIAGVRRRHGVIGRVWSSGAVGFTAQLSSSQAARLRRDHRIRSVERDTPVHISTTQSGAPWGLDRIDQRYLPLSTTYQYAASGAGVKAYVVDTGIRSSHTDFAGRVSTGAYVDFGDGTKTSDCNGHGTHVSGTLGGTTYGVAKGVTIVPVKALDCTGSGFTSGIISALNWVIADHLTGQPAVLNMSLEAAANAPLDAAVEAVVADGVTVVVAAGNAASNSCATSPARVPSALTVGASDANDANASFTNYGSCNDLFAPGVSVPSDWYTSDTASATLSGTSMASPHVAGAAAIWLQTHPSAVPAAVDSALVADATLGVIADSVGQSPNALLYIPPAPAVCASGLTDSLAWWQGQDSTVAHNGPNLGGTPSYSPAVVGDGFSLAPGSALSIDSFAPVTAAVSFEAWIRPVREDWGVQDIASRWNMLGDDGSRAFALQLFPNDQIVWSTDETTTMRPIELRATVPQLYNGAFHHLAATWDQQRFALYLDGTLLATRTSQGGALNAATSTQFRLGSEAGIGDPFWYNGVIDDAAVFGRALTADEVGRIYAAGPAGKCG